MLSGFARPHQHDAPICKLIHLLGIYQPIGPVQTLSLEQRSLRQISAHAFIGPIGLVALIRSGQWPPRTLILFATNDFIWWIPFSLYIYDAWPEFRREFRWPT